MTYAARGPPAATTTSPPIPGPITAASRYDTVTSPLAAGSSGCGTTAGIRAASAGRKNASPAPTTKTKPASTSVEGVHGINASASTAMARNRSDARITKVRGSRSAHTPPTNANETMASQRAPRTRPRSPRVPPASRTAIVTAIGKIWSPSVETAWPTQSSRKSRSRRAAAAPDAAVASSGRGHHARIPQRPPSGRTRFARPAHVA